MLSSTPFFSVMFDLLVARIRFRNVNGGGGDGGGGGDDEEVEADQTK